MEMTQRTERSERSANERLNEHAKVRAFPATKAVQVRQRSIRSPELWRTFFAELLRRKVLRAAGSYIVSAWIGAQVVELLLDSFAGPDWMLQLFLAALLCGFPIFLVLAWVFELTPSGLRLETDVETLQARAYHARFVDLIIIAVLTATVVLLLVLTDASLPEPVVSYDIHQGELPL